MNAKRCRMLAVVQDRNFNRQVCCSPASSPTRNNFVEAFAGLYRTPPKRASRRQQLSCTPPNPPWKSKHSCERTGRIPRRQSRSWNLSLAGECKGIRAGTLRRHCYGQFCAGRHHHFDPSRRATNRNCPGSAFLPSPLSLSILPAPSIKESSLTQDLETIPLAARSFANIAYLVPGTEPVEPSDPTKARITAVSTGGSSGLNNELSVDGGDDSDDYIGGFLQNFSPDTIQEFAFRTAQDDADTGRTTAGSVVITTNTELMTGTVTGLLRARRCAECAFSHRKSCARSQAAVLPPKLRRDDRRSYSQGKILVLLFLRICARRCQHRLQPGQPNPI